MILLTREDAVTPGLYLQAGDVQGARYVTVGSNAGGTVWLEPQAAREFGEHLMALAERCVEREATREAMPV